MKVENDWTKDELRWLKRMKKVLSEIPKDIRLYTTDGEIYACKAGVSSSECWFCLHSQTIINAGAMLTDMHDDMNFGNR